MSTPLKRVSVEAGNGEAASALAVLNALPHPVVMIDAEGFIAEANDAAQNFFQASAAFTEASAPTPSPSRSCARANSTRGLMAVGSAATARCNAARCCCQLWRDAAGLPPSQPAKAATAISAASRDRACRIQACIRYCLRRS